MIIYFANRNMEILGNASTSLPKGLIIKEDVKAEDVETGIATFECCLPFDDETRLSLQNCTKAGNYILRSNEDENEFYTIIETEIDTKNREIYIYAESAGLDLLNEIVGEYSADHAYTIDHYINKFSKDSGFKVGINEVDDKSLQLSFDSEETATSRIASIANIFGAEISYSFKTNGLKVTDKIINIYEKKGDNEGITLRLNKEIDKIVTKTSVANVATALLCEGGTPENAENPITLKGYSYDDGDFYIEGKKLYSRKALENWSRYLWAEEPNQLSGYEGHIVKTFSSNALTQKELCDEAIAELKKMREVEANYEIEFNEKPDNVKIGDTVYVVDDAGELYLSTRILQLEESIANQTFKATLGEFLLKDSGISSRVEQLAAEFAKNTVSVKRAAAIAGDAKELATEAKQEATNALSQTNTALDVANDAKEEAEKAYKEAVDVNAKAEAAKAAVDKVEESVESIVTTVENAQEAAANAWEAADTAQKLADEAKENADFALERIQITDEAVLNASGAAYQAHEEAVAAQETADGAKDLAFEASTIAQAAKLDAQQAEKDIEEWAENLETYKQTATAEYARKTDLTTTEVALQAQIAANANELSITHTKVAKIDETTNNAFAKAELAQAAADLAQQQADKATEYAEEAQAAADTAQQAATEAQQAADNAKTAADTAQALADKAEEDLDFAKADLDTVSSRADATQEEIAAAQQRVDEAQAVVDTAIQNATTAKQTAINAQGVADEAKTTAVNAQNKADNAVEQAELAQANAEQAKGNATEAINKANEAKAIADEAQETANTAVANAENAQIIANTAAADADTAQQIADDAKVRVTQLSNNLAAAERLLSEVLTKVDATQEEVEAAYEAVDIAQAAADEAQNQYAIAQIAANEAQANADEAQAAADKAREDADVAQKAAAEANAAVKTAWEYVLDLAVRVINTETDIKKNSEEIILTAVKKETKKTLGGYYSKAETEAALSVKADEISSNVKADYGERLTAAESSIKQLADSISVLIRKGDNSSQMVFDEKSATWSFNTDNIDENIEKHTEDIESLKESATEANANAEGLKNRLDEFEEHISISTFADEPCIILHEDDSNYKQIITNKRRFYVQTIRGADMILSSEDFESVSTNKVTAKDTLQVGGYVMKKLTDGSVVFDWEGVVD